MTDYYCPNCQSAVTATYTEHCVTCGLYLGDKQPPDDEHPSYGALKAENERLREALEIIAQYDKRSPHGEGICPYGCDTPHIAQAVLRGDTNG